MEGGAGTTDREIDLSADCRRLPCFSVGLDGLAIFDGFGFATLP